MSHCVIGVIVKDNLADEELEGAVEEALAPFDESLEVPPYKKRCWCVGRQAKHEASDRATAELGSYDDLREQFHKLPEWSNQPDFGAEDDPDLDKVDDYFERMETAWQAFIKPRADREKELLAAHDLRDQADPTCGFYSEEDLKQSWTPPDAKVGDPKLDDGKRVTQEYCYGTGEIESTYPIEIWRWIDNAGQEMGITYGAKVLPEMREASLSDGVLSSEESVGRKVQLLQDLYTETQQKQDGQGPPSLAPESEVRNLSREVRANARSTGSEMCDLSQTLQGHEKKSLDRSLSQDEQNPKYPLPSLQHASGQCEGQSRNTSEGNRVFVPPFRKFLIGGPKWDWWVIGGRWNGMFKPKYRAQDDPANWEKCPICSGTGRREVILLNANDPEPIFATLLGSSVAGKQSPEERQSAVEQENQRRLTARGEDGLVQCSICDGKGTRLKWPSQLVPVGNDAPVSEVLELYEANNKFGLYGYLDPDGNWHEKGKLLWFGCTEDEMTAADWRQHQIDLLNKFKDGYKVVIVDIHI